MTGYRPGDLRSDLVTDLLWLLYTLCISHLMGAKEARNAETQVQQKIPWAKAAFFSRASLIGADRVMTHFRQWFLYFKETAKGKKKNVAPFPPMSTEAEYVAETSTLSRLGWGTWPWSRELGLWSPSAEKKNALHHMYHDLNGDTWGA